MTGQALAAAIGGYEARPDRVVAVVRDVEVSEPIAEIAGRDPAGRHADQAWLLVRAFTEPLGILSLDLPAGGLPATAIAAAITDRYWAQIALRVAAAGGDLSGGLPASGVRVPRLPGYLSERDAVLAAAVPITVVICTRNRPQSLARCLASVVDQRYPRFRVLVIDNGPEEPATAQAVREVADGRVEYLAVPRAGLANARNAALAALPGETIAWLDDDEVADPYWLCEVARALAQHPEADIVCGAVVPAELETKAQLWFEEFGGLTKGRGFTPALFSPATAGGHHPLYPLPSVGAGANMATRAGVIESIGGFDPALGAGTPAMGAEDTLAFMLLLRRGGTIAYHPSALVRHYHRRDLAQSLSQLVGYGTGLTAAYTSLVLRSPSSLPALLRLVPRATRDLFGRDTARTAGIGEDFPRELLRASRRAMLKGPWAYLRGRRQARQGLAR